jgi:hypothetical protein
MQKYEKDRIWHKDLQIAIASEDFSDVSFIFHGTRP